MPKSLPVMPADEIRSIRARLKKTQVQMAELLGVHWTTYQKWELERNPMTGPAAILARKIIADDEKVIDNSSLTP